MPQGSTTTPATAVGLPSRTMRFCAAWLLGVVVLVVAVGTFNAVIDPYLVIGAPRIAGLNAIKSASESHTRLAKSYLLARAHPAGLMLGDSKVDIGLDPDSPAWPEDARPAFNLGMPGASLAESLANLRQAIATGAVRRALVFIELGEVMAPASPATPIGSAPSILSGLGGVGQVAQDKLLSLFSLDALRASLLTIAAQRQADVVDLSAAGSTGEGGFRALVRSDGYDALFLQKDVATLQAQRDRATALRNRPDAPLSDLDVIADIITLCRAHGVVLDLVLSPFHADFLEGMNDAGLWPRYEAAKRTVTRLAASKGVGLWDFDGYDAYTTEPVPSRSERGGDTRWFWEPSHFKKMLGEVILQTIFRGRPGAGFGQRLTQATIEARLAAQRHARTLFEASDGGTRDRLARAQALGQ